MATWIYFGLWLAAALVLLGFVSAALARHWRRRELRRRQGLLLLDALDRYCEWLAAQRQVPVFQGESAEAAQALDEAGDLRAAGFPELAGDIAELLATHARILQFLSAQDALRQRDAEAWLETDHDGRFEALWRQQLRVLQTMQARLALLGITLPQPEPSALASRMRESQA